MKRSKTIKNNKKSKKQKTHRGPSSVTRRSKIKYKRKNPIELRSLVPNETTVFLLEKPLIFKRLKAGGKAEVSEPASRHIFDVNFFDLSLEPRKTLPIERRFGISPINEAIFDQIDFYSLSGNENINLRKNNLVLDIVIFREVDRDKLPIPNKNWKFHLFLEKVNEPEKTMEFKSTIEYSTRHEAFDAARRMVEEKWKILVPRNILPKRENMFVQRKPKP